MEASKCASNPGAPERQDLNGYLNEFFSLTQG